MVADEQMLFGVLLLSHVFELEEGGSEFFPKPITNPAHPQSYAPVMSAAYMKGICQSRR